MEEMFRFISAFQTQPTAEAEVYNQISSETSVLTRTTRSNILEDGILRKQSFSEFFKDLRITLYILWNALLICLQMKNAVFLRSVCQLLVTANAVPSSLIFVTWMMEAISSSERSVLSSATRCKIPEEGILHSHRRENLKSYTSVHV
jgi:hypothetical protein